MPYIYTQINSFRNWLCNIEGLFIFLLLACFSSICNSLPTLTSGQIAVTGVTEVYVGAKVCLLCSYSFYSS